MINNQAAQSFVITGGTPLRGSIKLSGAKNAAYKLMIASLLGSSPSTLANLPEISDVVMVAEIIRSLGGQVSALTDGVQTIDPSSLNSFAIGDQYGQVSRASTLFIAPLLARFGEARVPMPGGDQIGTRPLERHFDGLKKMGATLTSEDNFLVVQAEKLVGTHYRFTKNTHTGTETLIMAAVLAEGKTILENAAAEPEVDDLILFLNKLGAKIRRTQPRQIEIEGVEKLTGASHTVMPDRNEAVSYAVAALATKGDITVENARPEHLIAFLDKLREVGAGVAISEQGIRFYYQQPLKATNVQTAIHPGFMTDWQPLWAVLMCHAEGVSVIHETVMQNRFQYLETLRQMGAKIAVIKPELTLAPEQLYNFNWSDAKPDDIRAIQITGPTLFHGGEFAAPDLRAGAIILIAALSGQGQTILHNIEQIERGYAKIDQKLISLGAKIERIARQIR
jgi:UDP-N-acetylglucosamine 1-carboxyvinyltransferase